MEFSFLTYNILFNTALSSLKKIIIKYQPDILCLQEIDTSENNLAEIENLNYKLANFSNYLMRFNKIFGMATFYNATKFYFDDSQIIPIQQTLLELIISLPKIFSGKQIKRNFLKTIFIEKKTSKKISIYNTHLTVYGSNNAKIKQIKTALNEVKNDNKHPVIIAGDFNYFPYGRKKLEKTMEILGFKEATANIDYTIYYRNLKKFHYNFIPRIITKAFTQLFTDRLKIDYIFFKNLKLKNSKRIEVDYSDHFPIFAKFKF
jgi:endonuclease/exonuclease/phosphatase family metal-dependent hydrolase